jgi:hypothetical protein
MALRAAELDEDVQLPAPNGDREESDVLPASRACRPILPSNLLTLCASLVRYLVNLE